MSVNQDDTYNVIDDLSNEIHTLIDDENLKDDRGKIIRILNKIISALDIVINNIDDYIEVQPFLFSSPEKERSDEEFKKMLFELDEFVETLENDFENFEIPKKTSFKDGFKAKVLNHLSKIDDKVDDKLDKQEFNPKSLESLKLQIVFLHDTIESYRDKILNNLDSENVDLKKLLPVSTLKTIILGALGIYIFTGSGLPALRTKELEAINSTPEASALVLEEEAQKSKAPSVPDVVDISEQNTENPQDTSLTALRLLIGTGFVENAVNNLSKEKSSKE